MSDPRSTPRVFLPQETWMAVADLSGAAQHGVINTILARDAMPAINFKQCLAQMEAALGDLQPGDSIATVPCDPMALIMVGMVLERLGIAEEGFTWLRFERRRDEDGKRGAGGFYVPSIVRYPPAPRNDSDRDWT